MFSTLGFSVLIKKFKKFEYDKNRDDIFRIEPLRIIGLKWVDSRYVHGLSINLFVKAESSEKKKEIGWFAIYY